MDTKELIANSAPHRAHRHQNAIIDAPTPVYGGGPMHRGRACKGALVQAVQMHRAVIRGMLCIYIMFYSLIYNYPAHPHPRA